MPADEDILSGVSKTEAASIKKKKRKKKKRIFVKSR